MDKIDNVARMAIKITLKHEKLQRMLNDKIVRALVDSTMSSKKILKIFLKTTWKSSI